MNFHENLSVVGNVFNKNNSEDDDEGLNLSVEEPNVYEGYIRGFW